MKSVLPLLSAFSLVSLVAASSARAASISYVGSQLDVEPHAGSPGTGWRTPGNPTKPLDIDGDGIIGTDGYDLFDTSTVSLPTYVSAVNQGSDIQGTFSGGGYAQVEDPLSPATATVQTGTWFINGAPTGEKNVAAFTLQNTVPGVVEVGLLYDSTDNTGGMSGLQFRIHQTSGGSGDSGDQNIATGNGNPDWYFFDITGGQAGDVYTVSMNNTNAEATNMTPGGISFDSPALAVPENATFLPVGVAMAAVALLLRRRFAA